MECVEMFKKKLKLKITDNKVQYRDPTLTTNITTSMSMCMNIIIGGNCIAFHVYKNYC